MNTFLLSMFFLLSWQTIAEPLDLPLVCTSSSFPENYGSILTLNSVALNGAEIKVLDHPEQDAFNSWSSFNVALSKNEFGNPIYYLTWASGASLTGGYRFNRYYEISEYNNGYLKLGVITIDYKKDIKTIQYVKYNCVNH